MVALQALRLWPGQTDGAVPKTEASSLVRKLRRSPKALKPNPKYFLSLDYLFLIGSGEPEFYDEALQVSESAKWEHAMQEKMDSLYSNETWELVAILARKKVLHNK